MQTVSVSLREDKQQKPADESQLGFGQYFSDHMLLADYSPENGWHDYRIVPYGDVVLQPHNLSLHYGQLIFEGLKAYINQQGEAVMFRPKENMERMNKSGQRLCIPSLDVDFTLKAIKELIEVEKDWIPKQKGNSLYVRPFIIATENAIGVKPSSTYRFYTILSPVGSYYKGGVSPTKIYVEETYVRAVQGGTGEAKCAGNYASSLLSQVKANEKGYDQVLWLDAKEKKYVEEVGTSNVFFVMDGQVVTPELNGSILPGITRNSTLQILKHWGMDVVERKVTIEEVMEKAKDGSLSEAFATGTAAVVSPIGTLCYKDDEVIVCNNEVGPVAQKIYDGITSIQYGLEDDVFGWIDKI